MDKIKRKNEKMEYKVFTIRLHEETKQKFIDERKKSGLSWNRYIYNLIKEKP